MARRLVIIHGYSDSSDSFQSLASHVASARGEPVPVISLGDYVSLSDHVTFDDLVAGMDRAWDDHQLPREPHSVDAIVHSTGGLVIRDWMSRMEGPAPIKHLAMLAPANFGSPLAHKGRSFIGRVIKGFGNSEGVFQSGARILKGLELASPFSWNLALRDRFGERARRYGRGGVLCTVLVGNRGYDGIRAIANEDGGDGTVRVSTANLNCARLEADFTGDPMNPTISTTESAGRAAFRVVDGHNHSSITLAGSNLRSQVDRDVLDLVMKALDVTDAGFTAWCDQCDEETGAVMEARSGSSATQGFQNTVVRLLDHEGHAVGDYLVEFYEEDDDRNLIAKLFHTTALAHVHVYGDDPSFRSLYVNCTKLTRTIDKLTEALSISVSAHPVIDGEAPAGFRTFGDDDIGAIRIPQNKVAGFFRANRTLLVTLRIRRERADRLFRFKAAGPA
jgi:hypothetical protein